MVLSGHWSGTYAEYLCNHHVRLCTICNKLPVLITFRALHASGHSWLRFAPSRCLNANLLMIIPYTMSFVRLLRMLFASLGITSQAKL